MVESPASAMDHAAAKLYQTWTTDSRRWQHYAPRPGDIIVATYPKCGTTWTQRILDLLVHQDPEPRSIHEVSPWIDMRFGPPIEAVVAVLEGIRHRRYIKAHLPLDGLPWYDEVRYVHVARDGRDACMSFFNHCAAYTEQSYALFDRAADDLGGPAPRTPDDPVAFFRDWLTRGVAPGVEDGFPSLSFFDFETTWWRGRTRENVLLVHYNDLLADLDGEMRRIADFLAIDVDPAVWPALVEAATFGAMKRSGRDLMPAAEVIFEGGADRFLFQGRNERWRDVIPPDLIEAYERKARERFTPGLRRWIAHGRLASVDPRQAPA